MMQYSLYVFNCENAMKLLYNISFEIFLYHQISFIKVNNIFIYDMHIISMLHCTKKFKIKEKD